MKHLNVIPSSFIMSSEMGWHQHLFVEFHMRSPSMLPFDDQSKKKSANNMCLPQAFSISCHFVLEERLNLKNYVTIIFKSDD